MPLYEYETSDGERVTEFMEVAEMRRRQDKQGFITLGDGRRARRTYDATKNNVRNGCWPRLSDSLGCHSSQIPEKTRVLAEKGVDARFSPDGRLEIRDHGHEKQVMRALGCRQAGIINRKSYVG